jgi:hydrogenase maturation protease
MESIPRILVAGIGNIFLGDDAFGSEVARLLLGRPHPPHVQVVDFGIRGLDLVFALLDGCDAAILIDAAARSDDPPGALYLLEPELDLPGETTSQLIEAHSMDPVQVLRAAAAMGARVQRVFIVGCQPTCPLSSYDDGSDAVMEMSPAVAAAIPGAAAMVESLIDKLSGSAAARPQGRFQEVTR